MNELIEVIAQIEDPALLARFFDELFTDAERNDFELRWELMKKLRDGIPQREIAAQLGVSLCKITRGSKIIKDEHSATNCIMSLQG